MARRSFAHTERPQGAPKPMHQTQALNALSALAKRGSANVNAEQLQRPMPDKKLAEQPEIKPPSPAVMEAINRSYGSPQVPSAPMQPVQQPQVRVPEPVQQQPAQEFAPVASGIEYQPPPYDGYYADGLRENIKANPMPPGEPDWRIEAINKFDRIRNKLNAVRAYINSDQGQESQIRPYVREQRSKLANA